MSKDVKIRALIVGAGEIGTALFNTIIDEPGVSLTGIVDGKNKFSSFDLAGARNIPVFTDISEAMQTMPDIVFHLSDSEINTSEILVHKLIHTEIIENKGAHFFLNMIHQSRIQTIQRIHQHKKEAVGKPGAFNKLHQPAVSIYSSNPLSDVAENKKESLINILCIDNDERFLKLLLGILEPAGYKLITAREGKEGIEKAITQGPDLIILDLIIPDMDGFDLPVALKDNAVTMDIPIIVLTAKDITVRDRLKLIGKIESMMQKSCFTREDLLAHIGDLEITYPGRIGLLDTVSGLFDRSYFQIRLAQEICRADRHKTVFSILMVDIDGFSEYVRVSGMHNGNICIQEIADFLRETTRGSDILTRYGTDEFAILLASATEEATYIVASRLLSFIESYHFPGVEGLPQGKMTASIATVHYDRIGPITPEKMISKAEELIREAKKDGGGNIKIYGLTSPPEIDPNVELVFRDNLGANSGGPNEQ